MERYLLRMVVVLMVWLVAASVASAQTVVEYIHTDALGTPIAVTNSAGAVIERSVYEPYGQLINRPLTDGPGFTGHVQDAATGLTYMQQRYYDPLIGRFLSVDPVTAHGGDARYFHRYWYAAGNPYKYTDPDGRVLDTIWDVGSVVYDLGKAAYGKITGKDHLVREGLIDAGVDSASMLIPFVPAGASKLARAGGTIVENAAQGAKAEAKVAAELGAEVAGKRVTLEASTGQRSVADIVTTNKGVVEVKTGSARLSTGQKAVKADIEAGRPVTPRGQNAADAGLTPNQPVQMKCYDVKRC